MIGREEKRLYRRWQHDDWNEEVRRLLPPAPPGEVVAVVRDYSGRTLREIRDSGPDTVSQFLDAYGGPTS
ncbi:hypothetical protein PBI_ANDREW_29 [Arthrobacter phage Andrew]|uniref:Uncharacterized protein n=1 Tax=Arthrobacter phage Andrew TaxID=2419946 RepID=A0A3G2KCV1_9CAUD|nr:hypothetical protein HOU53_gp29 [Arthrobacter phage Andrew]AYN56844.1 hypothetical protein PBI_ANDREW_29 [Arthrobacter phage Andrew]